MQYLMSFGIGIVLFVLLLLSKIFTKKSSLIFKIVGGLGALVLAVRMFCYQPIIMEHQNIYWGLESSPLNDTKLTAISLIMIWASYSVILFAAFKPFFNIKLLTNIVRFIILPILIIQPFFLEPMCTILQGVTESKRLIYMYSLETAFGLGIALYTLVSSFMDKEYVKVLDIPKAILGFALLSIATMPTYFIQYMFGYQNSTKLWEVLDFSPYHRIVFYGNIILPFFIHFFLKGKDEIYKRFILLFICYGTLVTYLVKFSYTNFNQPWTWPFHLCNTAMFILPLVLTFRMKKFFYFTYFINVFGALMAMLMPNYDADTNIMAMKLVRFWWNHYMAFVMPILFVAEGMFERPKLKEFIYSMIAFFFYFVLVLVLNVVFTEMGHEVDFFFLNSDFIADKLGTWAEDIFKMTMPVTVGGKTYVFRPLYQGLFFTVYVLLGLAVWFVYEEAYRMFDENVLLHRRLAKLKKEQQEFKKALMGRKMVEPMDKDAGIKFELDKFSKQYASSKRFAVKDASFEVYGGEIFGFLGPNGAGKSTIIKSTVGIQPITSGNIRICGYDVATQPVQAKSLIGFVPDHYALYEKLSGREYINYIADIYNVSKKDRDERIEKYVKLFELEHSIDNMIKTYSHGMKQKITIMAALVHDPKVWILDEPLTGLDPNSIYQVKECMKEHASRGNIVFFSSHIIDVVEKLCERVAIIKLGEVQCVKTVKEIEAEGYTLEQYYLKTIDHEIEGISPVKKPAVRRGRPKKVAE